MDRDGVFSPAFRKRLTDTGMAVQRIPPRCPWLNGHAERMVKTFKDTLLRKAIWADGPGLAQACAIFIRHYCAERPHQALDGRTIEPQPHRTVADGPIIRRQHLGGLINHYYRVAG